MRVFIFVYCLCSFSVPFAVDVAPPLDLDLSKDASSCEGIEISQPAGRWVWRWGELVMGR